MRNSAFLGLLVASFVTTQATVSAEDRSPRINDTIAALVSSVEADGGASVAYVSTCSSLNFIRQHAWILTLATDKAEFGGEFFILSEIDGQLVGEILAKPGPDGTIVLTGNLLSGYLAEVKLDFSPIRTLYQKFYSAR